MSPWMDRPDVRIVISIAIGLLIGAERERRKAAAGGAAGIRTFALVSLAGGLAMALGSEAVLAVSALGVLALAAVSYLLGARDDPGLTTEVALLIAFLLGAMSFRAPALASGVAVVVTLLLAARARLHAFVQRVLTEREMLDFLLLAAAVLVVLPLAPDRPIGPFGAVNPHRLWRLLVLVMALSSAGYVAVRALGARVGLPLSGLFSGFVSGIATIGAMGARAKAEPAMVRPALAGAAISNLSTVILLGVVVGAASDVTLGRIAWPLLLSGLGVLLAVAPVALRAARETPPAEEVRLGRLFDLRTAVVFVGTVALVTLAAAALHAWLGEAGVALAAGVAGFADAHAASISAASLVAAGQMAPEDAVIPILLALTTNTVTKAVVAVGTGGRAYARRLTPALIALVAGAWAGVGVRALVG